ncbi:MAG TPA: hypothetical protein VK116_02240, partial [Planctomycetota bacterium]|nr:hypothetical protein [Planctomycetota bacterium]
MNEPKEPPGDTDPSPLPNEETQAAETSGDSPSPPLEPQEASTPPAPDEPPDAEAPRPFSGPRASILIGGLVLCGILALWSGSRRELWGDEVRHALLLDELQAAESWQEVVFPRLGGEPHLQTPPLFFWLAEGSRIALDPLGVPPLVAYRVPLVLCALLGVWLTYLIGRALFDGRIAFLGAVLHGTTALFFFDATRIGPELLFTTFCELAAAGFILAGLSPRVDQVKGSRLWSACLWIGLALAALSGPVVIAVALVVLPFTLAAFFRGGVGDLRATWRRAMGGKAFLLLFIAIAAPWFIAAGIEHRAQLWDDYVLAGHLGIGADEAPRGFLGSYPVLLVLGFLPWTFFVPIGVFHGKDRTARPGQRAAIYWVFGGALLLVLIPPYDSSFLLYLWPPLALLIPAALYEELEVYSVWESILLVGTTRLLPRVLRLPIYLTVVVAGLWLAGALPKIFGERFAEAFSDRTTMGTVLALWAAGGVASWFLARRVQYFVDREERGSAVFESARAALFFLFIAQLSAPVIDRAQSARFFVESVKSQLGDVPIASYGATALHELDYYLGAPHEHFPLLDPTAPPGTPEDAPRQRLEAYLKSEKPVYILASQKAVEGLEIQFPGLRTLFHRTGIEGWLGADGRWVVLSNRKVEGKPQGAA